MRLTWGPVLYGSGLHTPAYHTCVLSMTLSGSSRLPLDSLPDSSPNGLGLGMCLDMDLKFQIVHELHDYSCLVAVAAGCYLWTTIPEHTCQSLRRQLCSTGWLHAGAGGRRGWPRHVGCEFRVAHLSVAVNIVQPLPHHAGL